MVIDWLNSDDFSCVVTHTQGREEFTAALLQQEYDVILSDYSLPGFNGIEALDMAQAVVPNVPFLFVSGQLGEELAIETLKRGATDYVLKGRLARLVPAVKRALLEAGERRARQHFESTLRILSEASLALSSLDYATILTHIARLAVPHFADYCVVDVLNADGTVERVATAHADPQKEELARRLMEHGPAPRSNHPIWQVLESGRSIFTPSGAMGEVSRVVPEGEHEEILRQLGLSAVVIVPLMVADKAMGAMTFVMATPARSYSARDVASVEDLARRCALAVENARLHKQTLEALRARDEFLAVLSHELRSPLGAILGWTHLLQSEGADSQLLTHGLDVIERNTRAQVQLVQDLLEVSRIITGRLHLEMAPVVLCDVIDSVRLSMEPASEAKGVRVSFANSAPGLQVLGDAARIQQVVWNLVSNAVKFTPKGGEVSVALQHEPSLQSEGGMAVVTVSDSGEGIGPEFLPYVFDRFRQADSSSTRSHGGLGLGLSIVRHLTEMHGGSVQAQSEGLGQGATFTVRLPVRAEAPEPAPAQAPSLPEAGAGALSGAKILLVEDGDDAREVVSAILRRAGAVVTAASSAQAAMDLLESASEAPDLMVSDIGMPDEDGYALLSRVQAWSEQSGHAFPAIALTAYASEQDRQRATEAGFRMHLSKPVSPALLVESVAGILSAHRATAQRIQG